MLDRYAREPMARLWGESHKFETYLRVEQAVARAWHTLGLLDAKTLAQIEQANFSLEDIHTFEKRTRHDVIAFIQAVSKSLGDAERFFHYGITSSDCIDTALALLIQESLGIIFEDLRVLLDVLKARALEFKEVVMVGRSHGVHGEPTSFGLVWALWYEDIHAHWQALQEAAKEVCVGMVSGAMGNMAHSPFELEELVCQELGLGVARVSNQVIPREKHARLCNAVALLVSTCEKIAINVRHYQRTEVYEAEEAFSAGQKGSSAMPHKRNPVLSENITGLARMIRAYAIPMMENVALWHERDISHSSVERFVFPDMFITLDFLLHRLATLLKNLLVYPENMRKNLERTGGLVFSQRVLLELPKLGFSKAQSYAIVQENAMWVWARLQEGLQADFLTQLLSDARLAQVDRALLKACFETDYYLRNVGRIFDRVFGV
ncbi:MULTISPECIES: adenylosuccinate lyase [Helicobacter]|uniref:adenylosuccinate lyase n=1 Tax=Helicobacter TaxID=209 RepID=UPI000EB4297F|nr:MULTISPECIES: adenylosuccinate lyase [Helicobacter]